MCLFLHHLIRKYLAVLQHDAHRVSACGQTGHIEAFQILALCLHQAALQVVEFDLLGCYVGRVLQMKLVLGGVGVEQVGTVLEFNNVSNIVIRFGMYNKVIQP